MSENTNKQFNLQAFLETQVRLLIIEDNPGDTELVRIGLQQEENFKFDIRWAQTLNEGMERLNAQAFDCLLLDLSLPDVEGLEGVEVITKTFPRLPVIVLTGMDDTQWGVRAIQKGSQEFLNKNNDLNSQTLVRAIRYSILRKESEQQVDDLIAQNRALQAKLEEMESLLRKAQSQERK